MRYLVLFCAMVFVNFSVISVINQTLIARSSSQSVKRANPISINRIFIKRVMARKICG